jgi:hypothetical protein
MEEALLLDRGVKLTHMAMYFPASLADRAMPVGVHACELVCEHACEHMEYVHKMRNSIESCSATLR